MENENPQNEPARTEPVRSGGYFLKKEAKERELQRAGTNKKFKKVFKTCLLVLVPILTISSFLWYLATRPPTPEADIVSKRGLHWHSQLSITTNGQKQEVSANIGIGGGAMKSTHTHDISGQIHLEKQGLVTKNDISLAQFFKIWGKQFNSNCIFDSCNEADKKVKLFVNGVENFEFENYTMKDKDVIEIKYESR